MKIFPSGQEKDYKWKIISEWEFLQMSLLRIDKSIALKLKGKKSFWVLGIIELSHFLSEKEEEGKKMLYIELKSRTLSMRLIRYQDIS